MKSRIASLVGYACILALVAGPAPAHDPGLSTGSVQVGEHGLRLTLQLAPETRAQEVSEGVLVSLDGRPIAPRTARVERLPDGDLRAEIYFEVAGSGRLAIDLPLLAAMPHGHRMHLTVDGETGGRRAALLDRTRSSLIVAMPTAPD